MIPPTIEEMSREYNWCPAILYTLVFIIMITLLSRCVDFVSIYELVKRAFLQAYSSVRQMIFEWTHLETTKSGILYRERIFSERSA